MYKVGDRVVVSATYTGTGETPHGVVTKVENQYTSDHQGLWIDYAQPTSMGFLGTFCYDCHVNKE